MKRLKPYLVITFLISHTSSLVFSNTTVDTLRLPISNTNISISPDGVRDQSSTFVLYQIYEGLVGFNERLEITPLIANKWMISLDGLQYNFSINSNIEYAPQERITGVLIASYYEWLIKTRPDKRWLFEQVVGLDDYISGKATNISGIIATDDTISFRLVRPSRIFLVNLASSLALIGFRTSINSEFKGTGPYRFLSKDNNIITLVKNPLNPRSRDADVDKIVFLQGNSNSTQREMFESGQIDMYQIIDLDGKEHATSQKQNTYTFQNYALGLLILNQKTTNLSARKAICKSLNKSILAGKSKLIDSHPTDSIIPNDFGAANSEIICSSEGIHRMNLNRELRLLTSEQYYFTSMKMFSEIKRMLHHAGLTANIIVVPHSKYIQRLYQKDFDIAYISYLGDYPDPDAYYYPFLASKGEFNFMGLNDSTIDLLLSISREVFDDSDRLSIYKRINKILGENPVVIPLFSSVGMLVTKPHIYIQGVNGRGIFSVDLSRTQVRTNFFDQARMMYEKK